MDTLTEAIRYLDYHPEYSAYLEGKTPVSGDPENPLDEEDVKRRKRPLIWEQLMWRWISMH